MDKQSKKNKTAKQEVDLLQSQNQGKAIQLLDSKDHFLSALEASIFLKLKIGTIYKKVENYELPHYRIGKRKLLFSQKELLDYVLGGKGKTFVSISNEVDEYINSKK